MAGPLSRPSMNTAPCQGKLERAVLPIAQHVNGDEGVAENCGRHGVLGWPGQRPGHDEIFCELRVNRDRVLIAGPELPGPETNFATQLSGINSVTCCKHLTISSDHILQIPHTHSSGIQNRIPKLAGTPHTSCGPMNFMNKKRNDRFRRDAYAAALALAGVASVPMLAILAISTLALFIARTVWRFLG